jgi:hypothetical protein
MVGRRVECSVTRSGALPDVVLGPLAGRTDADWHRAPPGRWSPAQIVQHLTLSVDYTARAFEARRARAPMRRRPRSLRELVAYLLVFRVGWVPAWESPAATRPSDHPARDVVEREFRDALERFIALERVLLPSRAADLFVKHPLLGDLTLPEWGRFHLWHFTHHARQIHARLAG